MNTYDICIVQRPGDTHFGMELVDHNGEPITGEIKYNKYGVSIPYGIYDAIVATITRLQTYVKDINNSDFKSAYDALKMKYDSLNAKLTEYPNLVKERDTLKTESVNLRIKIRELNNTINELKMGIMLTSEPGRTCNAYVRKAKDECDDVKNRSIIIIESDKGEPVKPITFTSDGIYIPTETYNVLADAIVDMKAEIGKLEAEVSKLRADNKMLNGARRGDKNNINKLIAEKHQLSEALTSCGSENKELHRKIDELTAKHDDLEQNFKEVCDEVVAEQENNAKLREKLKKARETNPDIEKLNLKLDIAHKENMNLNNEIAELRKETIRLTSELNKEQCKNVSNELKELAKNMYSTEIPDTLENNDYITRPPKFEGVYDVGRYNAVTGRLDHVAKLHIAEDNEWAFAKFHKITCMFKPCQISDIIAWGKLNEDARFKMCFVMDDDKPDTQDNDTKPETKHEEHPMDSILKAFSGILPKTVNVMDTKNGDGHHIADLLTCLIRSMDEDTFKKVFDLDDEE